MKYVFLMDLICSCWIITGRNALEQNDRKSTPFGDEARLLRQLMKGYERAVRPVHNASHSLTVKVGFALTQILDVDEKNQILTINVWISLEWSDQKLVWDPAEYNGLKKLRIPPDLIWRPDIVLYNGVDDFGDKVYSQCLAMVKSDGTVLWAPIANLKSSCKLDLTYFPFDDQACNLKFGSWAYDGSQVDLTNQNTELEMHMYIKNGGWDVLKTKVVRNVVTYPCCPSEPYPDVTFSIYLRRRPLYYVINVFVPCILLSGLSLFGFFLPVGTGEKVSLGLTVLLAFYVLGLSLADRIPETSEYIPLIGLYLTTIMILTTISIAMCVFVIQLHYRAEKNITAPPWLYNITMKYIARIVCMSQRKECDSSLYADESLIEECKPLRTNATHDACDKKNANNLRSVPTKNNGTHEPRQKDHKVKIRFHPLNDKRTEDNDPSWLMKNNHQVSQNKVDFPVMKHISSNETMWHDMASVWDRLFLLTEFITVTGSTVIMLLIMPMFKHENI